jgi:hypothetical protein
VWSGVEWSGVEWSGVEWSGVEWSGVEWSGVEWSGLLQTVVWSVLPHEANHRPQDLQAVPDGIFKGHTVGLARCNSAYTHYDGTCMSWVCVCEVNVVCGLCGRYL